mmetsp:Transcript_7764/g.10131  ORF Transcript_7764/g.10131 Transcript_7764/m.10131 type:complete len:237 (-) Transcript_7764:427-1137(-)
MDAHTPFKIVPQIYRCLGLKYILHFLSHVLKHYLLSTKKLKYSAIFGHCTRPEGVNQEHLAIQGVQPGGVLGDVVHKHLDGVVAGQHNLVALVAVLVLHPHVHLHHPLLDVRGAVRLEVRPLVGGTIKSITNAGHPFEPELEGGMVPDVKRNITLPFGSHLSSLKPILAICNAVFQSAMDCDLLFPGVVLQPAELLRRCLALLDPKHHFPGIRPPPKHRADLRQLPDLYVRRKPKK